MSKHTPQECFVAKDQTGIWYAFQVQPKLHGDGCWDYDDEDEQTHCWIRRLTLEQMEFLDSFCDNYVDSLTRVRIERDDTISILEAW